MLADAVPPVDPAVIVAPYAPAPHNWLPAHRGVDFAASEGTPVRAVRGGTIVLSRMVAGRPVVVLRSRGVRFTHEPVVGISEVGEHVPEGEVIGVVGAGGHCATVCLHWGAKVRGEYVNPLSFLPVGAPVLKPVRTAR